MSLNLNNKIRLVLMVTFIIFGLLAGGVMLNQVAEAHSLKFADAIGMVIHIDPDDSPIAGKATNIYVDLKVDAEVFAPSLCRCNISVQKDGQEVIFHQLQSGSDGFVPVVYTFPEPGAYNLKLTGYPQKGGKFESFELNYAVNVREVESAAVGNGTVIAVLIAIAIGLLLGAYYYKISAKSGKISSPQ